MQQGLSPGIFAATNLNVPQFLNGKNKRVVAQPLDAKHAA